MTGNPALLLPFALFALLGCGSTSKNAAANPTPTPMPMVSPTPSPASDFYLTTMFPTVGHGGNPPRGQVKVDMLTNNGFGNVLIDGASLRAGATLQFCPIGSAVNGLTCFNVPTTPGNGVSNFQIPVNPALAGIFQVNDPLDGQLFSSGFGVAAGVSFQSALLPASSITGGVGETTGSVPLTSGSVTVTDSTLHIVMTGTAPNHVFSVSTCIPVVANGCLAYGNVVSGADGSVNADLSVVLPLGPLPGGIIVVRDSAGAQFISGFRLM